MSLLYFVVQDKQLFLDRMKVYRPSWAEDRLEKEWSYLLATVGESKRAYNGPHDSPLQMPIPAWMLGEEAVVDEVEDFQTRQLQSATKAQKWNVEESCGHSYEVNTV